MRLEVELVRVNWEPLKQAKIWLDSPLGDDKDTKAYTEEKKKS